MGGRLEIVLQGRTKVSKISKYVGIIRRTIPVHSDPSYRKVVAKMAREHRMPRDMISAIHLGMEIALDAIEAEARKEDLNVQRTY
jgi:hypothetical protein